MLRSLVRVIAGLILLGLLLAGWVHFAPAAAEFLIVSKPVERPDAIVVLSGATTYGERCRRAAEKFRNGAAPRIVLTDDGLQGPWSRTEQRNPRFVELARAALVAQGVPAESITVLEPAVDGTMAEARLVAERSAELGLKRLLIVTSAYHSRRALRSFERAAAAGNLELESGIDPVPPGIQTLPAETWWHRGRGWQMVGGEYLKSVYYWLAY